MAQEDSAHPKQRKSPPVQCQSRLEISILMESSTLRRLNGSTVRWRSHSETATELLVHPRESALVLVQNRSRQAISTAMPKSISRRLISSKTPCPFFSVMVPVVFPRCPGHLLPPAWFL